ncbi:carboxypeptidase family protein, partial [Klebsiella pneumoniae]
PSQYDADGLHFQLEPEESEVRFAYFEPYSRERHARLVERALGIEGVERLAVGTSVQGRDIELLRVRRHPDSHLKLWVIAQQHPGEHMAEWFM